GPPTELLVNVADKITEFVPNADMVRFTNSGTESTMYAIRFARAYTGKDKIIKFEGCYNGGHDYVLINTHPPIKGIGSELRPNKIPDSWGIPHTVLDTVIVLPWNNVEVLEKTIERHAHELAAVITEPVLMNIGCCPPEKGYLEAMRKLTEKNDICLIFDEIITGFRMALGGAQEYFNIKADLATFAKALGAGFPLGAITGTKEIMKWVTPPYIAHYGTYNANPICLAAAEASLAILSENDQAALKRLNELGSMLIEGVRNAVEKTKTQGIVQGIGGLGMQLYFTPLERIMNYRDFTSCDVLKFRRFHKELLKKNIYVHPNQNEHFFISTAHSEDDVVKTISAINEVLRAL
ncbi:MAG: aminotransferase class III-fold pyridoxal phosphate-dependent enzyme, partial [Nitrososphaeria archaeon]|nr:aminotransferase class III-fold pyridoxal phosphate-dependent enzyme [Nitrososphaeria archaeon]NIQ32468.1 aminotransferase class III-fold pyridoxal phosphate-dependent enzyme [Nitrososphaeria archaeon]